MTRGDGELSAPPIAQSVARRLGYRVPAKRPPAGRGAGVPGARVPPRRRGGGGAEVSSSASRPRLRYSRHLEAAVLEAAIEDRVVLGRALVDALPARHRTRRARPRSAPPAVRAQPGDGRHRIGSAEAAQRIAAYDDGVRARMRQMFDVDWTDPLLYDLVINTETIGVMTAVEQVLALAASSEFQPTLASRQLLADRTLAARVRAIVKAHASHVAGGRGRPGGGRARPPGGPRRIRGGARGCARRRARGARRARRCRATSGSQEAGPVNWAERGDRRVLVPLDPDRHPRSDPRRRQRSRHRAGGAEAPARQQWQWRLWGTVGAVRPRIVFIAVISVPAANPVSSRPPGGAILLWIAVKLLSQEGPGGKSTRPSARGTTLLEAIWTHPCWPT